MYVDLHVYIRSTYWGPYGEFRCHSLFLVLYPIDQSRAINRIKSRSKHNKLLHWITSSCWSLHDVGLTRLTTPYTSNATWPKLDKLTLLDYTLFINHWSQHQWPRGHSKILRFFEYRFYLHFRFNTIASIKPEPRALKRKEVRNIPTVLQNWLSSWRQRRFSIQRARKGNAGKHIGMHLIKRAPFTQKRCFYSTKNNSMQDCVII
jgi:hypothetical protein